jgi:alpha-N-arabinofuranosidase
MNLETILAVWDGLYLDGTIVAEADLQPYIDDALNELEFLLVFHTITSPDLY